MLKPETYKGYALHFERVGEVGQRRIDVIISESLTPVKRLYGYSTKKDAMKYAKHYVLFNCEPITKSHRAELIALENKFK